jgi:aldose 1-epimerase
MKRMSGLDASRGAGDKPLMKSRSLRDRRFEKTIFSLRTLFAMALLVSWLAISLGLADASPSAGKHAIKKEVFGKMPAGNSIDVYTLTNSHGIEARIMNFGGIVLSLRVPDRNGKLDDVVLGFDRLEPYFTNDPHFGSIIGRYANRIANGKFTLDGVEYTLPKNNGPNTLHGGVKGFDKVPWQAEPSESKQGVALVLRYTSKNGEEGFPGNLKTKVTYTLSDSDELAIEYEASTDKATPVNLTSHGYFNLAGQGTGNVLAHELLINADRFTPVDKNLIPTGELRQVQGTPLDFTGATAIGARINDNYEQLVLARGYDHNFVINRKGPSLELAARVHEPSTGRILEIYTTEPGVQFYSANFLDGTITGKQGRVYKQHYALCLETQHFPDSPNHPSFPSTILKPGQTYTSRTVYKFSVDKK